MSRLRTRMRFFVILAFLSYCACLEDLPKKREVDNFENIHKINSFVLGTAIGMLLFICFFSYIFTIFGLHLFPEPSVCLICGMLVGYGIRYFRANSPKTVNYSTCAIPNLNSSPPESILVTYKDRVYDYDFGGIHEENEADFDMFSSKVMFDPDIFFYLFLPPIMFNFGFKMKKVSFF